MPQRGAPAIVGDVRHPPGTILKRRRNDHVPASSRPPPDRPPRRPALHRHDRAPRVHAPRRRHPRPTQLTGMTKNFSPERSRVLLGAHTYADAVVQRPPRRQLRRSPGLPGSRPRRAARGNLAGERRLRSTIFLPLSPHWLTAGTLQEVLTDSASQIAEHVREPPICSATWSLRQLTRATPRQARCHQAGLSGLGDGAGQVIVRPGALFARHAGEMVDE